MAYYKICVHRKDFMTPEQFQLAEQLKVARGKEFGKLLKQTYYALAPELVKEARNIIEATGKLNAKDIAKLAISFNLCMKHCSEFLEDPINQLLPSGTYQKMLDRGLKPRLVINQIIIQQSNNIANSK